MRPAFVWAAFAACLSVLAAAMAWTTAIGLRLERADVTARATATLEENTRLALWRLDSAVTPLLARESARPYFHYGAYYDAAAAYSRMHQAAASTVLVPSPLLKQTPTGVLLHFQVAPGGTVTSPEVPTGRLRARALGERQTTVDRLMEGDRRLDALRPTVAQATVWREVAAQRIPTPPVRAPASPPPSLLDPLFAQKLKSVKEYELRAQNYASNRAPLFDQDDPFAAFRQPAVAPPDPPGIVEEAAVAPLWVGDQLILARQVRVDGTTYGQAALLDWPGLRGDLLAMIADLLPGAQLQPVPGAPAADDERRLATLPVRLVPGPFPAPPVGRSVVRLSLAGAWLGLVVAAAAVALLLRAVMALSERRRVFVSAVTHELRTPLTTFRLYTDMMAEGMVPSEAKRREYVDRLRVEAQRLGHLVENVLAYARLENRRPSAARESVDLRALAADVVDRLADRTREAGLALAVAPGDGAPVRVRTDRSVVEQILVNLVDNACKYARSSEPPIVDVSIDRAGGQARLRVRDHGSGLSPAALRRLFEPFSKSDREAAESAPGLGLGLALCRSLARDQGGDLELDASASGGAAFVLTLPAETGEA
jgi:signal transduction histidine kinase